jgi:hypothetical protein
MSIFYRIFPPAEIKVCLRALDEIESLFSNSLYSDQVLARVRAILLDKTNKPHLLKAIYEAKNSPRDVVLYAMVQQCKLLLSSGNYHIYRGALSGEGSGIRAVFGIALDELVKSGFADEEQAVEQRAELHELVKDVG